MLAVGVLGSVLLIVGRRIEGAAPTADALSRLDRPGGLPPRPWSATMLAFLLFAGATRVDLHELRRRRIAVVTLATLGVLASTVIVGFGVYGAGRGARHAPCRSPGPWCSER